MQLPVLPILVALLLLPAAPAAAQPLRPGDQGERVRSLNQRLISLGYLPGGRAGTSYDSATFHAVMAVQKWNGLTRDGVTGPRTRAALRDAARPSRSRKPGRRIEVSLSRQVALLIDRAGTVRRTISVSTGAPGHDTPRGSFRVFRKELRSWSVPYRVWLPYASYFNAGIAFHEASDVPAYPASHGCVRVPEPFAAEVYAFASRDTDVRVV